MFCLRSLLGALWCLVLFKSPSHFEFIFVHSVRTCPSFTDVHAAVVFPASLAEETAFAPFDSLASFAKIRWP